MITLIITTIYWRIDKPFVATKFNIFKEIPVGFFWPCSHCLIVEAEAFKNSANTAWLTCSFSLMSFISIGEKAFTGGFSTFEKAVEALSDQEKKRIFGPDTNIWYNAEVMDPGSKNVILYDDKTLKIHNVGHFIFDRESGEKEPIPEGTLETLDNAFDRMKQVLHGDDFDLAREAIIQIKKLEDDKILEKAISQIDSQMKTFNNYFGIMPTLLYI